VTLLLDLSFLLFVRLKIMIDVVRGLRVVSNEDGAVILDIAQNAMVTLNGMGSYVWSRLERGVQFEAIVRDMVIQTGATEKAVVTDLQEFIEDLSARRLVTLRENSTNERTALL
jgi:hypothetical protein